MLPLLEPNLFATLDFDFKNLTSYFYNLKICKDTFSTLKYLI